MIIFSLFQAAHKKTAAAGHFYLPLLTPRRMSRHYQYHCRVLTLWSTPLCTTPYTGCARCKTEQRARANPLSIYIQCSLAICF